MNYKYIIALFGGEEVDDWEPSGSEWLAAKTDRKDEKWTDEFFEQYKDYMATKNSNDANTRINFDKISDNNYEVMGDKIRYNYRTHLYPSTRWQLYYAPDLRTIVVQISDDSHTEEEMQQILEYIQVNNPKISFKTKDALS